MTQRTLSFLAATILLTLGSADSAAQRTAPPIRRIDHIMIRADDPALSDGPAIRLLQAGQNTTRGLVISVASLPRAKAFLREKGLLAAASDDEATIDPSKIHRLDIRVVGNKR